VIVVIGALAVRGTGSDAAPAGLTAAIATSAAAAGARIEVVSVIGDDPAGDELALALARSGVGHVATSRDAAHPTIRLEPSDEPPDLLGEPSGHGSAVTASAPRPALDSADVSLALRYLTDFGVIVVVHPSAPAIVSEAVAAAGWSGAHVVVVATPGDPRPDELPADALVVEAPAEADDAGGVGDLLGRYAAAVDGGSGPAEAYRVVIAEVGGRRDGDAAGE
jgi:hypothetical protein